MKTITTFFLGLGVGLLLAGAVAHYHNDGWVNRIDNPITTEMAPSHERLINIVRFVPHDSRQQMQRSWLTYLILGGKELRRTPIAFTTWFKDRNKPCTIYAPAPKGVDDRWSLYIIGHELMHCVYGSYHNDWPGEVVPDRVKAREKGNE